ncbi:replication initiator protein A [Limosilactobacillus mucosae]|uniref:replication initiator protein A n=1 Tax=Limosilactobacillus mucosae TaxID=97478 RepID=UPI003C6D9A50
MTSKFVKVELDLLQNDNYRKLDGNSMLMYSLYRSRLDGSIRSAQNGNPRFIDSNGQPFIYFTNDEMAALLHTSRHTVTNARKKLIKFGLIHVERTGMSEYRVYVNNYVRSAKCEHRESTQNSYQTTSYQQITRSAESERRNVQNVNTSKTKLLHNYLDNVDSIDSSAKNREEKIQNEAINIASAKSDDTRQPTAADDQKTKPSNEPVEERSLGLVDDNDLDFAFALYRSQFGHLTNYTARYLESLQKEFGARMLSCAIKLSKRYSISNPPAYIAQILYTDRANGITNLDDMVYDHLKAAEFLDASFSTMNQNRKKFRIMTQEMLSQFRSAPKIPILKLPEDDAPSPARNHAASESEYEFREVPIMPPKQNWQSSNPVDANNSNFTCNFDQSAQSATEMNDAAVQPSAQNDQFADYPADWLTKRIANEKKAPQSNDAQQRIVEQAIGQTATEFMDAYPKATPDDKRRFASSANTEQQSPSSEHEKFQPPFSLKDFKKQIFGFKQNGLNPGMA